MADTNSGKRKLDWQPLDITALGSAQPQWQAFAKVKEAVKPDYEAINAKLTPVREKLEEAIIKQMVADGIVTNTQTVRFAYNFGKVAFAVVDTPTAGRGKAIALGNTAAVAKRR